MHIHEHSCTVRRTCAMKRLHYRACTPHMLNSACYQLAHLTDWGLFTWFTLKS